MSLTQAAQAFAEALLGDDPVALYDHAPCGYLTTLQDGSLVKVNQTFLVLTGFSREEALRRRFVDFLTPGGRIFHETHFAPLLEMQDSVRELAFDLVRRDGSRLPVLLNASVERTRTGDVRITRIAVFEATERRRYERELVRATQAAQAAQHEAQVAEQRSQALVDTLQSTLVPRTRPGVEGLEIRGIYRPAGDGSQVGGDFYDAFDAFGDCWLVLGDVSGKGVDAAVVTALVRNGARALALSLLERRREPAEILRMLDQLVNHHETERFCTATVIRLRRRERGWHLSYSSGGHPPVLHRSGEGTSWLRAPGPALGLGIEGDFEQHEGALEPGESLLLYTDGVTEARRGEELYGDERLHRVVATGPPDSTLVDVVLEEILEFGGPAPRDDIACLCVTAR